MIEILAPAPVPDHPHSTVNDSTTCHHTYAISRQPSIHYHDSTRQFQTSTPRSTTRAVSEGILLELHHGWDEEESRPLILDLFLVNSRSINELLTSGSVLR